jgi:hypothetical protein
VAHNHAGGAAEPPRELQGQGCLLALIGLIGALLLLPVWALERR